MIRFLLLFTAAFVSAAPLRVFTPENVDDAGNPPVTGKGFGDVDAGYDKLWGLQ